MCFAERSRGKRQQIRTIECTELLYVPNEPVYANSPPDSGMRFESYWLANAFTEKQILSTITHIS